MEELESKIGRFLGHFERRLLAIHGLKCDEAQPLFQKSLYVALLDALARCRFPAIGNRARFTQFVREHANWQHEGRISLPHLHRWAVQNPNLVPGDVRDFATELLEGWRQGSLIGLDRDPALADVEVIWPGGLEAVVDGARLSEFTHGALLYRYRNSLVHELRHLGYGQENADDTEPYYLSTRSFGDDPVEGEHTWELVYPAEHLSRLCAAAIGSLANHLRANSVDPFASYRFGTYWLPALNP